MLACRAFGVWCLVLAWCLFAWCLFACRAWYLVLAVCLPCFVLAACLSGRNGPIHEDLTTELAQKLITPTHKHIDKFILETQTKHGMTGTVGDLRDAN